MLDSNGRKAYKVESEIWNYFLMRSGLEIEFYLISEWYLSELAFLLLLRLCLSTLSDSITLRFTRGGISMHW